jgi:dihydrofolate synthase/folylpolyglutamate synthase
MHAADAAHPNRALQAKLASIYALRSAPDSGGRIALSLRAPYLSLLEKLGHPEKRLPPALHVAGTNGKGSVIAYLRAMAEAAGLRVHAYTSPHLRRFNERIVLAGREIEDAPLEALLDETLAHNGGADATFFEITTALAFAAFARAPADLLLLETGLGGRLDCTNVVDSPAATIITAIGLDHMEFLGGTLPLIAGEKAGIMKPGAPCIVAPQEGGAAVTDVFLRRAAETGCPLFLHGRDWETEETADGMRFCWQGGAPVSLPRPALLGPHQIANAGTALAALAASAPLFPAIGAAEQAQGLARAAWPGRLQQLPAPAPGWELWFDGGHNQSCARALAAQAARWQAQDGKPLHLVIGMMAGKAPEAFLAPLAPYAASVTAVGMEEPNAFPAGELARRLGAGAAAPSAAQALAALVAVRTPGRVLATGSFYLYREMP